MHFSKLNYAELFLLLGIILTLSTRLLTNEILKNKYNDTDLGNPINLLPWSHSVFNVMGFLAVLLSIVMAFSVNLWAGFIFIVLYTLTNLVPSKLNYYKKLFNIGGYKKCTQCNVFIVKIILD